MKKEFRSFTDARKIVQSLKLKNNKEWRVFSKSGKFPKNIPKNPDKFFKDKGWISWGDFLGSKNILNSLKIFKSFEDARKIVHKQNLKNNLEWKKYCKSKQFPEGLPINPDQNYKNVGWISWENWLGIKVDPRNISFKTYDDAKKSIKKFKIQNQKEWQKFAKTLKKPNDIPADSIRYYKDKGWINWGDFLSTGNVANQDKQFLPIEEARKFIQSLGLKSQKEWRDYCNSGKKPNNIPTSPEKVYSKMRKMK